MFAKISSQNHRRERGKGTPSATKLPYARGRRPARKRAGEMKTSREGAKGMNQMTKKTARAAAILAALLASDGPAEAAGLRTKFGEVIVRGLKIGQTYSLNNLLNLPLRVVNTGAE